MDFLRKWENYIVQHEQSSEAERVMVVKKKAKKINKALN